MINKTGVFKMWIRHDKNLVFDQYNILNFNVD